MLLAFRDWVLDETDWVSYTILCLFTSSDTLMFCSSL